MKSFSYEAPKTLVRTLQLLAEQGNRAKTIAGGTDLLVRMKEGLLAPEILIDILGVPEMKILDLNEEGLRIGALTTHADIAASSLVLQNAPVLAQASGSVGAEQTRNLGTIGGNLCAGVPAMDSGPALLALEADAVIAAETGFRSIAILQFFKGPSLTALTSQELLVEILIPRLSLGKPASFRKFGRRKALSLALVNAASAFRLNGSGRIVDPRVALGAVAPTPIRAMGAETYLEGRSPDNPETFRNAATMAAEEASPIDDFRASAEYRRQLIKVLVQRTLEDCAALALKGE